MNASRSHAPTMSITEEHPPDSSYDDNDHSHDVHDDDDDDGGNSCGSSVEAPPFALAAADDDDDEDGYETQRGEQRSDHESQSSPIRNIRPGSFVGHSESGMVGSHAWSSITTTGSGKPMFESVSMDRSEQQSQSLFENPGSTLMGSPSERLPSIGQSSHLPGSGIWTTTQGLIERSAAVMTGSLDFSQLMREADDRNQSAFIAQSRLPSLPEEQEFASLEHSQRTATSPDSSTVTPRMTNLSGRSWFHSVFFGPSRRVSPSSTMMPMMSMSPSFLEERVAITAGGRNIRATRLGENTFEASMHIDPPCTVKDVMDVVGNPDLLRLWCDPIRALVVTKSSEGARNEMHRGEEEVDREYEGEWIEATTSTLESPSKHSSCLYSLGQTAWNYLGFPSYGKVTMFIERRRGQMGLTIGPFSGGLVASHTLTIHADERGVLVIDKVRLSRDEEHHSWCCGLCDVVTKCFMPRLASHMDQVLSSLLRLRVLVEQGEMGSYATGADIMEGGGVSNTPLLG